MDLTEISEKIRDHLTKQKSQSVSKIISEGCRYRGPGGQMCAVGCLITDDEYKDTFEGGDVLEDPVRAAVLGSLGEEWQNKDILEQKVLFDLLFEWQFYHDGLARLGGVGYSYGDWCKGKGTDQSPSDFHNALMEAYR